MAAAGVFSIWRIYSTGEEEFYTSGYKFLPNAVGKCKNLASSPVKGSVATAGYLVKDVDGNRVSAIHTEFPKIFQPYGEVFFTPSQSNA